MNDSWGWVTGGRSAGRVHTEGAPSTRRFNLPRKGPPSFPGAGCGSSVKVTLDATPLLGPRTGVGRYVQSLLGALAAESRRAGGHDLRLSAVAVTVRGRSSLRRALPPGVSAVGPPMPARALQRAWARHEFPSMGLLTGRTDVVHGTNFVLPPPGRAAGVLTVHDLSFLRTPSTVTPAARAYRELVPTSIRRAGAVLTPSRAVAEEVCAEYGLSSDRVTATPLGVDGSWSSASPPDAAARNRLGLPERWFVVVGNLEPRKNLPVLVSAYREALRHDPEIPALVFVGPPGWGPALDVRGIPAAKIVFTGHRTDADLQTIVAGATALLFPTSYEGFGLPPLEAFACGVPVIASDLPVTREVLGEDSALARLVTAGDPDTLGAAVLAAGSATPDPAAAAARRQRAAAFSWEQTAAATLAVYREVAGDLAP